MSFSVSERDALWSRIAKANVERNACAERLMQENDPRGKYEMAQVYRYGYGGTHVDYPCSLRLYKEAAKQGHTAAAYDLTHLYLSGDAYMRVTPNVDKARKYAQIALTKNAHGCVVLDTISATRKCTLRILKAYTRLLIKLQNLTLFKKSKEEKYEFTSFCKRCTIART